MPAQLDNALTGNNYSAALTVEFPYPRVAFSAQVYNAAAYYQLGVTAPGGRGYVWEATEHFTAPAMLMFNDPVTEGFPQGSTYAAIRYRSAAAGVPARVTNA